jgi:inositol-phosphate phosphatase/L-galactose 1-phosphate phosphatase/histidinol-phosphatase
LILKDVAGMASGWLRGLRPLILEGMKKAERGDTKGDISPVTTTDVAVETALCAAIDFAYPSQNIIGEELPPRLQGSPYTWYIDPLDGTKSFITGRPLFGVLLGLCHEGVPVLGLAYQPVTDELWLGGQGVPARCNTDEIQCNASITALSDAILATTAPDCFNAEEYARFQRVHPHARFCQWGGDWHNYALLARGGVDVVIEAGLKPHDILPLMPIIEAAGGTVRTWDNVRIREGATSYQVIAAANTQLLDAARECMLSVAK